MSSGELIAIGAAVFAAGITLAIAGFGFALLAVPLMSLAIGTHDAVLVSTAIGLCTTTVQAVRERRHADRLLVARLVLAALAGMPFGLLIFHAVGDRALRLTLGLVVLLFVVLLVSDVDVNRAGRSLELAAGFTSGILSTSLSTNGPPLVFVLTARRLTPDRFRGTIQVVFALCGIATVGLFASSGDIDARIATAAAVALPANVAGVAVGVVLRRFVTPVRFRRITLILLTFAGVTSIAGALSL